MDEREEGNEERGWKTKTRKKLKERFPVHFQLVFSPSLRIMKYKGEGEYIYSPNTYLLISDPKCVTLISPIFVTETLCLVLGALCLSYAQDSNTAVSKQVADSTDRFSVEIFKVTENHIH
jgi:hypothetical protein